MKKIIIFFLVALFGAEMCMAQMSDIAQTMVEYNFNSDKKVCIHNPHPYKVIVEYNVYCTVSHSEQPSIIVGSKGVIIGPDETYISVDGYGSLAKDGGEHIFATAGSKIEYYYIQLKAYKLLSQK